MSVDQLIERRAEYKESRKRQLETAADYSAEGGNAWALLEGSGDKEDGVDRKKLRDDQLEDLNKRNTALGRVMAQAWAVAIIQDFL